jgi:hypothetical protein
MQKLALSQGYLGKFETDPLAGVGLPAKLVIINAVFSPSTRAPEIRSIEDIDAPLLTETRATNKDGYLNVVIYTTETKGKKGGVYEPDHSLRGP